MPQHFDFHSSFYFNLYRAVQLSWKYLFFWFSVGTNEKRGIIYISAIYGTASRRYYTTTVSLNRQVSSFKLKFNIKQTVPVFVKKLESIVSDMIISCDAAQQ